MSAYSHAFSPARGFENANTAKFQPDQIKNKSWGGVRSFQSVLNTAGLFFFFSRPCIADSVQRKADAVKTHDGGF